MIICCCIVMSIKTQNLPLLLTFISDQSHLAKQKGEKPFHNVQGQICWTCVLNQHRYKQTIQHKKIVF